MKCLNSINIIQIVPFFGKKFTTYYGIKEFLTNAFMKTGEGEMTSHDDVKGKLDQVNV